MSKVDTKWLQDAAVTFAKCAGRVPRLKWDPTYFLTDPSSVQLVADRAYVILVTTGSPSVILPISPGSGERCGILLFVGTPGVTLTVNGSGSDLVDAADPFPTPGPSVVLVNATYYEFVAYNPPGPPFAIWNTQNWMGGVSAATSPGVIGVDGGKVSYKSMQANSVLTADGSSALDDTTIAANSLFGRPGSGNPDDIPISADSLAARVASAAIASFTVPAGSIIVRQPSGNLGTLAVDADNSVLIRRSGTIQRLAITEQHLLGRITGSILDQVSGKDVLEFARNQGFWTEQGLSEAATIDFDVDDGLNCNVALTASRNFDFLNTVNGDSGFLTITQSTAGGWQLTFLREGSAAGIGTPGGSGLTLSNGADKKDIIRWYCDGSKVHLNFHVQDSQ